MNYNTNTLEQGNKAITRIINECHQNDEFKTQLISDPVATMEKFLGTEMKLPKGKEFVVVDQTDPEFYHINIPQQVSKDNWELSEQDLDTITGGGIIGLDCPGWGLVAVVVIGGLALNAAVNVVEGMYDGFTDDE